MDHDDVIVPDRDNVIAMYHDHNIMMGPGKETVTDHDHGITMGHDDGALTVRNGVTIMDLVGLGGEKKSAGRLRKLALRRSR